MVHAIKSNQRHFHSFIDFNELPLGALKSIILNAVMAFDFLNLLDQFQILVFGAESIIIDFAIVFGFD